MHMNEQQRSAAHAATGSTVQSRLRRWWLVLALLAMVIAVDQAAKWWAWRHIPGANINPGGDFLTGPTIGRWYANPVTGALLDLMSFALVSIGVAVLARRPRQSTVTVCGSLMIGGWASNLLDRLGMHYWTAPGSIRGAVDFISVGSYSWNVADFFIIGATPLFLLATAYPVYQTINRAAGPVAPARRDSRRVRVPIAAAAGAALITTVALGATHHGTLARPMHASQLTNPSGWLPSGWLTPGTSHQREMAPDGWRHGGDRQCHIRQRLPSQ
jgi:lipoprotein signal peptidase